MLADAGYWHHEQMQRITERGIELLIPPDSSRRKGARPGWKAALYAAMRERLATDRGAELYRKRQPMIEPVFGQTRSSTAASTASTDEADTPPAPNGGSSPGLGLFGLL